MRYSRLIVHSILLFTVPALALYPQVEVPPIHEAEKDYFPNDHLWSYDSILNLLDDLESGELEKRCSPEDLERVNYFLANLAKQGILPNETEEELVLDRDIQELLSEEEDSYGYSFDQRSDYSKAFTAAYGPGKVIFCKSWIHKKWDQVKKFTKKHKKAIIIGAAVVVAAAVVVVAVAAASTATAAAAGAGAAGAAAASGSEKEKKESAPANPPPASNEPSLLTTALEEHVSTFKEILVEKNLLQTPDHLQSSNASFGENARNFGAVLAHQALDGVSELASCVPHLLEEIKDIGSRIVPDHPFPPGDGVEITPVQNYERLIAAGHEKIDWVFSTDQAELYTSEGKAARNKFVIGMLPPPILVSEPIVISKFREIIKSGQETALLAEELGFANYEILHLKNEGILEKTVATTFENIVSDRALLESLNIFKSAEAFLKPYSGEYLSETQARELIQYTGIKTFPRPKGIPENFRIKLSKKGAGIKYVHPENEQTYIRVMPGKSHSPIPSQQKPYVIEMRDGKTLDKLGNVVSSDSPAAHIALEEFVYRRS